MASSKEGSQIEFASEDQYISSGLRKQNVSKGRKWSWRMIFNNFKLQQYVSRELLTHDSLC